MVLTLKQINISERSYYMAIVTFDQMIELNEMIKNLELHFKIHLRDACGGQSFWIEPLGDDISADEYEKLYMILDAQFAKNKMTIIYAADKINFTVK